MNRGFESAIILTFLLEATIAFGKNSVENYSYIGLPATGSTHSPVLNFVGDVIFEGDVGSGYQYCDDTEVMHCFKSRHFSLAIPKTGAETGDEWSFEDIHFRMESRAVYAPIEHWIEVSVIRATRRQVEHIFYYSNSAGVVAIQVIPTPSELKPYMMLLHGKAGIGCHWRFN